MALMRIEFKDKEFKAIMEDLRQAEDLTLKAYRRLQELGAVSVEAPASEGSEDRKKSRRQNMALMRIEFKDKEFKAIMEDLRQAEDLTLKAYRRLQELGAVSVEAPASEGSEEKP